MIRPAPSVIIVGSGDLKEFEIRQKQHGRLEAAEKPMQTSGHNSTPVPLLYQTAIRTRYSSVYGNRGNEDSLGHGSIGLSPPVESGHSMPAGLTEGQIREISIAYSSSPENTSVGAPPTSPPKFDHEYGSLADSLIQQGGNDTSQPSSHFSIH